MAERTIAAAVDGELTPLLPGDRLEIERPGTIADYNAKVQSLGLIREVTQALHGLAAKAPVVKVGGAWIAADADSVGADAVVLAAPDANTLVLGFGGVQVIPGHLLTLDELHYLASGGGLTTSPPGPGKLVQRILKPLSTSEILIQIGEPVA